MIKINRSLIKDYSQSSTDEWLKEEIDEQRIIIKEAEEKILEATAEHIKAPSHIEELKKQNRRHQKELKMLEHDKLIKKIQKLSEQLTELNRLKEATENG